MALGLAYLRADRGGGRPAARDPADAVSAAVKPLVDRLHGVCLSGGPGPRTRTAYGAVPHAELGPTEPELDRFELELAREAHGRNLPILAICRGAQLFNVAMGGTLVQHLPDVDRRDDRAPPAGRRGGQGHPPRGPGRGQPHRRT